MKKIKLLFLIILSLTILVTVFLVSQIPAKAASSSDLTFELNSDGKSYCVSACKQTASGSVVIPSKYNSKPVTEIGDGAFYNCKKITSVTIPDSVVNIGSSAFENTYDLNRVYFGKGVRNVGNDAFGVGADEIYITDLSAWCRISWGNSYAVPFGSKIFLNEKLLTKLVIPSDITVINDYAFRGNESITSIIIHDKVKSVGESAFYGCNNTHTVVIGDGVTKIGEWAFSIMDELKNLTIGDSVTDIGKYAFSHNSKLEEVSIPNGVTVISDYLLENCDNLKKVTFGNNVTYIGNEAFKGSKLTSITIPRSVKKIGYRAFEDCFSFKDVYYDGSKTEWQNIDMWDNDPLINATIHFTNPCAEGHTCGDWITVDDSTHKRVCTFCGNTESAEHKWGNSTVTKPATCKDTGIRTYSCNSCKTTKTEIIEKSNNHTYGKWVMIDDIMHKRICSVCSKEESGNHRWNDGTVTKAATCVEDGTKTYTCNSCDAEKTEIIVKLDIHTYDNDCDTSCNVCEQIRTVSHNYESYWNMDVESHWHDCACGAKGNEGLHTPKTAGDNSSMIVCAVCGYVIEHVNNTPNDVDTSNDSIVPIIIILVITVVIVGGVLASVIIIKKKKYKI